MIIPVTDPPSQEKLQRLAAFAMVAWGDEQEIRYGFIMTKKGVQICVRQRRRFGNLIQQEGANADQVMEAMEHFLCILGAHAVGRHTEKPVTPEMIREIVEKSLAPIELSPNPDLARLSGLLKKGR